MEVLPKYGAQANRQDVMYTNRSRVIVFYLGKLVI